MGEWIVIIFIFLVGFGLINIVLFVVIGDALRGTKTSEAIDETIARWIKRKEKR